MLVDGNRNLPQRSIKLNTKPRTGPFIIDTGRTFSYIIIGPADL